MQYRLLDDSNNMACIFIFCHYVVTREYRLKFKINLLYLGWHSGASIAGMILLYRIASKDFVMSGDGKWYTGAVVH